RFDAPREQRLLGLRVAEPSVQPGERSPDGGEPLLRGPAPRRDGFRLAVRRCGTRVVVEVVLEQLPERHAKLHGALFVGLGLGELCEGCGVALGLPGLARQIEHPGESLRRRRRRGERTEAGIERVCWAAEVLLVERCELLLDLGRRMCGWARRELRFERAREHVVAPASAQRRDQAAALALVLARFLEGGLELLGRAGVLAAEPGDLRQL